MRERDNDALAGVALPKNLPRALVELRMRRGLTQSALAAELRVSVPTVRRWEAGEAEPRSLLVRARLSKALLRAEPLRHLQEQVSRGIEAGESIGAALHEADVTARQLYELLTEFLSDLDSPGAIEGLEQLLRGSFRQSFDIYAATVGSGFVGTRLAGLSESIYQHLERDALRPFALLVAGSLRSGLIAARAQLPMDTEQAEATPPEQGPDAVEK